MKTNRQALQAFFAIGLSHFVLQAPGDALAGDSTRSAILTAPDASWAENLAAREVRRYVYLRTGELLPITTDVNFWLKHQSNILVGRKERAVLKLFNEPTLNASVDSLGPQAYLLRTVMDPASAADQAISWNKHLRCLILAGADDAGTLYAAYRFAEILDVRFYLHGDVLPDKRISWRLPMVEEKASPLFSLRGILPFHDFPEGPDWWNREDYLAILAQLPKLRMNFFGLHTYPEDRPNAEPTVWIGLPSDIGAGGQVNFSYPSSYQSSLRGNWGYAPRKTSEYLFGTAPLFEKDDYAAEVMDGFIPAPTTPEGSNKIFERTARLLHETFAFAHQLGVKTCVGTETPLVVPKLVQAQAKTQAKNPAELATTRELYEGIFRRAAQAYPLDYYWLWTPEGWTWSGVKPAEITATTNDLLAAFAALQAVKAPFQLATCGWVLGPEQDRAMFDKVLPKEISLSCINRQVGYTPVDAGFAEVKGRGKWAIPWLEDDPALTSPQLWVGRMRRDAADALRYGCDGLMGIHWRTRVLGPNVSALSHAAWDQHPWADTYTPAMDSPRAPGPVGGQTANYPNNFISGTDDPTLYQTVRYNVSAYHLPISNGLCQVTLKFSEPHYDAAGKRVFDVKLQGHPILTNIDIFARAGKNKALDLTYTNILVTNGWLDIDFIPRVEFPSIAAIVVKGERSSTKINCGGPAYRDYVADGATAPSADQIFAPTWDFYEDWASHEFGPEVGRAAGRIFERVDCKLPIPSVWTDGPGGIKPDSRPWEQVKTNYTFVENFAALEPKVKGAGNQQRYAYWLNTFRYLRAIGQLNCVWGEFSHVLDSLKGGKGLASQKDLARQFALPIRQKLVGQLEAVFDYLLATASTTGELGTVANWNQHNVPALLDSQGNELSTILGEQVPAPADIHFHYHGPTRILLPAQRTVLAENEPLKLKVIVLSANPPRKAEVHWRRLGRGKFTSIPLQHLDRAVYQVELPATGNEDFEYYIQVEPREESTVRFPPTAPELNQTVVIGVGQ